MTHVAVRPRVEFVSRLAVHVLDIADGPGDRAEQIVAQRGAAVITENRHVDDTASGHLEDRGVLPLLGGRILDEVRHPVRVGADSVLRVFLHHHVDVGAGVRSHARGEVHRLRTAQEEMHDDEHRKRYDGQEGHH